MDFSLSMNIILSICPVGNGSILTTVLLWLVISFSTWIIFPVWAMNFLKLNKGNLRNHSNSFCAFFQNKVVSYCHLHSENISWINNPFWDLLWTTTQTISKNNLMAPPEDINLLRLFLFSIWIQLTKLMMKLL